MTDARRVSKFLVAALALAACSSRGSGSDIILEDDAGGGGTDVRPGSTDSGVRMDAAAACATATNCGACAAMGACGWCGATSRCLAGSSTGSTDMSCSGNNWAWLSSQCGDGGTVLPRPDVPPIDVAARCASATSCGTCAAMGSCGWCGRTGRCLVGTTAGSADMSCTGNDWGWNTSQCGDGGTVLPRPDVGTPCVGVPRTCELTRAGDVRTCTAGQMVSVGCSSACGLGSCTGDPVIQICPGDATMPCATMAVIASNDDAPATAMCNRDAGSGLCPIVTFMCPASGRYTVWTGPYDTDEMATCNVAVR